MSQRHQAFTVKNGAVFCACGQRITRKVSTTAKNPGRAFYSHSNCNFFMWEDCISELKENSNLPGTSPSTPQTSPQKSQTSESPSSPLTSPVRPSRSLPIPSNSPTPLRSPSGSTTMNGLSTPSSTPAKRDRTSMSASGSTPRRFMDPESQARRLAFIQAATAQVEVERRGELTNQTMQTEVLEGASEYGMSNEGDDEPVRKRLRFSSGSVYSPSASLSSLGSDSTSHPSPSSRGLATPPATGLPDVFGIHIPLPAKQEPMSQSTGLFTNVNGKQRATDSSSSSRSASMGSSRVKSESDADAQSLSQPPESAGQTPSSSSSSQASRSAVETPLSRINRMRDRDRGLDAQVQEFLSAADRVRDGADLVQRLHEALQAKDAELTETKKELQEVTVKCNKLSAAMRDML